MGRSLPGLAPALGSLGLCGLRGGRCAFYLGSDRRGAGHAQHARRHHHLAAVLAETGCVIRIPGTLLFLFCFGNALLSPRPRTRGPSDCPWASTTKVGKRPSTRRSWHSGTSGTPCSRCAGRVAPRAVAQTCPVPLPSGRRKYTWRIRQK